MTLSGFRIHFSTFILGLVLLTSCATRKALPVVEPLPAANLEAFLSDGPYAWDWFSADGQLTMDSPFFSGGGQFTLRMKQDSLVWLVVRYLGLEVARMQATPQEVILLNRWERSVEHYTWDELAKETGFPTSFPSLQRLVLGWLPLTPTHWQVAEQTPVLTRIQGREDAINIQADIESPEFKMTHCRFWDTTKGLEVKGRQEGWSSVENHPFSHARYWEMTPTVDSRVFLQIRIQNASFVGPLSFPFAIPDRYERGG